MAGVPVADPFICVPVVLTNPKLGAHFISKHWTEDICGLVPKTSYYYLPSAESLERLNDPTLDWNRIEKEFVEIEVPQRCDGFITAVNVRFCGLGQWKDCVEFLIKLTELKELAVEMFEDVEEIDEVVYELHEDFRNNLKKLKKLSITFIRIGHAYMKAFLNAFEHDWTELTHLKIIEDQSHELYEEDAVVISTVKQIIRIVYMSYQTLTSLHLDFPPKSMFLNPRPFKKLMRKLSREDAKLELQSALIWIHIDDKSSFELLEEFLMTQIRKDSGMNQIILPWFSNTALCQRFVCHVPRTLQFIGNIRGEHMIQEFWKFYLELNSMAIGSQREVAVFHRQPWSGIRKLEVNLRESFQIRNDQERNFYEIVGQSLVKLVELNIHGFRDNVGGIPPFYDHDLQLIIKNFTQLRDLRITRCPELTDAGITGIDATHIQDLFRTFGLYTRRTIDEEFRTGLPLTSLRSLEKLELRSAQISDLGIYHGLMFGPTLKEITIHTSTKKVTKWGMKCLGSGNPGLEYFDGYFLSHEPMDRDFMRKRIENIQTTGQFRFKNIVEPRRMFF